ncbi:MAG: hypothetical protein ACOYMW_07665 [Candidatus Competibacteraceae bacterium]
MQIVLLLVVLAIIGLVTVQWMGGKQPAPPPPPPASSQVAPPPTVPTRPQDLKAFEQDMNRFMQDTATQRDRQIQEDGQ